ncbi:hypothetical protein ABDK96_02115 [Citricoccus nitrophenolicus]|uniref:Phage tail protein n=1 Tax=Citricoccus nitrophenolicus TaxID=863575 RepID=A0ABV0IEQ8_9MICC
MARTIPGYPDPNVLLTDPVAALEWDGPDADVVAMRVVSEIGSGLPAQVVGGSDMVAADGSVTVKLSKDAVSTGLHLPWEDDKPRVRLGSDVQASMGYAHTGAPALGRVLTGVVNSEPSTDVTQREVSFDLVDRLNAFNRPISLPPLNFKHPPHVYGGPFMFIGLHPTYVTNTIARHCGFYSTPPMDMTTVFSAPTVGSLWPEVGTIIEADRSWGAFVSPSWGSGPWGLGLRDGVAQYTPTPTTGTHTHLNGSPAYLTYLSAPHSTSQEYSRLDGMWEGYRLRLSHDTGRAYLRIINPATGETLSGISLDLPAGSDDGFQLSARLWANGDATLRVNDAATTGTLTVPAIMRTNSMIGALIEASATTGVMAGAQIGFHATRDPHDWERTAIIETNPTDVWSGMPALVKRNCLDLLKEQAGAELAGMWLDDLGRFRYRSLERMLSEPVSETLTLDHMLALKHTRTRQSSRRSVRLVYSRPYANRSRHYGALAKQLNGGTLGPGEELDEIIHPESGVDWINVSPMYKLPMGAVNEPPTGDMVTRWMAGRGSFTAGVTVVDNERASPANPSWYDAGVNYMDDQSYRVVVRRVEPWADDAELLLSSPDWSTWPLDARAVDTPVVRAMLVQTWQEFSVMQTASGNPFQSEWVHDAGFWVQSDAVAQRITDHMARATSGDTYVLQDIPVIPDDRRQLADVIHVQVGSKKLRCLRVKKDDEYQAAPTRRTQTLTLQVIDIEEAN